MAWGGGCCEQEANAGKKLNSGARKARLGPHYYCQTYLLPCPPFFVGSDFWNENGNTVGYIYVEKILLFGTVTS